MFEIVLPVAIAFVAVVAIPLAARRRRERVMRTVQTLVLVACFIESGLIATLPAHSPGARAWHVVIAMCWAAIAGATVVALARLPRDTNDSAARMWRHVAAHRRSARRRMSAHPTTRPVGTAATNTKGDI